MSINRPLLFLDLVCGGTLFALYFQFLGYILPTISSLTNPIEVIIFYTLTMRAIFFFAIPRLRRVPGQIKIGVFSIESFVLIFVILLYVSTGDPGYSGLIGPILTSWIGAGLVIITPYSILEFMISMYKLSTTITSIFVFLVAEFASVIFLSNIAFLVTPVPSSLQGLGLVLLATVRTQPGTGITSLSVSNDALNVTAVILYACMIFYVVLRNRVAGKSLSFQLILALIGTFVLLMWSSLSLSLGFNIFLSLTVPGAGIPLLFLVALRGKK